MLVFILIYTIYGNQNLYLSLSSTDFEVIAPSISASDFEVAECWGYNRFFRLDLLVSVDDLFCVSVQTMVFRTLNITCRFANLIKNLDASFSMFPMQYYLLQ